MILSSRLRVRANSSLYVFHILPSSYISKTSARGEEAHAPEELVDVLRLHAPHLLEGRLLALFDVDRVPYCTTMSAHAPTGKPGVRTDCDYAPAVGQQAQIIYAVVSVRG